MTEFDAIAAKIKEADAILIGASNGLSITEGLNLFADDEAFDALFGDFKRKYGIRCILQGAGARWPSEEERWAFTSRLVGHYCLDYKGSDAMRDLRAIVGGKDYFIVTSNCEYHFELSGFDPARIYEIEGSWEHMQCASACHNALYPAAEAIARMRAAEKDGRVPTELIPRCPKCGGPMMMHVMTDRSFIVDEASRVAQGAFVRRYMGKKLVILELGIGRRNQMIKAPLMRLTAANPNATYITINKGEVYIPNEIADRSIGLDGLLSDKLAVIREAMERA